MSVGEKLLEVMDEQEDGEPGGLPVADRLIRRRQRLQRKNESIIDSFLGEGNRANAVAILPRYYGELLTWALQRYIEKEGWKVIRTLGYRGREPVYIDVNTDCDKRENLLMDSQLLVEKGDSHFIITVDINLQWRNSIQVEGPASQEKEINEFTESVMTIAKEQNFYRGKKIEFAGRLRFLNVIDKAWDTIILNPEVKAEIRANTIDFLNRRKHWAQYGIPLKRGILLAGESGTGKTVVCKALMAEADGVTCITTHAYGLDADEYITDLYELAQDLIPSIVFIEDIDLIGQNRVEFGYHEGPALLSLLTVLDGIEEQQEIVTVATTNRLEILDKAISQRPSRFDHVINLGYPSLDQRMELISLLCERIPVDEPTQAYIARKTEHCTPAQLQEIIYSLVIQHSDASGGVQSPYLKFRTDDIDSIISNVNGRNRHQIGFCISGNHNGHRMDYTEVLRPDSR